MVNLAARPTSPVSFPRLAGLLALLSALSGCVIAPVHHRPPPPPVAPPPPQRTLPAPPPPATTAGGPAMYFYPERGQDEARQDRDRYECYRWAVRETGVDPGMTPLRQTAAPVPPPPPPPNAYPVLRDGAPVVAGAATGAVIGAVTSGPRHTGQGAVLGAIFGATLGAIAQEQQAQAAERAQARQEARQEAWQARQQQAEAAQRPLNDFRRAMGACMGGRGYKVG